MLKVKAPKIKPSLESLLAESKILTGKQVVERQKLKEAQQAEFLIAAEFESRYKKVKP
ncbi:hypothetical protein [Polynucleobacter paneuropaeus]|uniref:hypothetical protein n=1 Tax=Polynucleobacter paneuropaeus TaxID=2527775 RepID=UPI0013145B06|nr:hypothetical protein [Polynucleobacter paneuropaeus]